MRNFGMPTLIENGTIEENVSLCNKLGLSFIELNMNFPEYQIDKLEDTEWFYKKADEAGIYYTIHLVLGDGEIDLIERLKMAKDCNARCVLETKTIEALKKSVEWIRGGIAYLCYKQ